MNGDGYLDLAATTRKGEQPKVFLFQPPDGWLDSSEGIAPDFRPCGVGVDLVEFTGDGRLDLLIADHCSGLHLYRGDGGGRWVPLARLQHPSREGFNDAAVGDVNGDGRMDIVAIAAFTHGLSLYLQEPSGRFVPATDSLPRSGRGYRIRLADLDGDDRLDILASFEGVSPKARAAGIREAKVWLQRPGGRWLPGEGLPETGEFYGIAAGDLNEDGRPDLALGSLDSEGGVRVYLGKAAGAWAPLPGNQPGRTPGRLFAGVAFADFNGDGHLDLAAVEHRRQAVVVWMGDGRGGLAECPGTTEPLPRELGPGWGLAAGDIDRDGRPDLVAGFGNEAGGALRAWASVAPSPNPIREAPPG